MRSSSWLWLMLSHLRYRPTKGEKQWWRLPLRKSTRCAPPLTITPHQCLSKLPEKIRIDHGGWGLFIFNAVSIRNAVHDMFTHSSIQCALAVWFCPLFHEGHWSWIRFHQRECHPSDIFKSAFSVDLATVSKRCGSGYRNNDVNVQRPAPVSLHQLLRSKWFWVAYSLITVLAYSLLV